VDELVPARERRIHTKLKSRAGPDAVSRWKREMTARELFVAEAFMGEHLSRAQYERRYPGPLWKPAFALTRLYCHTALPTFDMYLRAIRFLRRRLAPRLRLK